MLNTVHQIKLMNNELKRVVATEEDSYINITEKNNF